MRRPSSSSEIARSIGLEQREIDIKRKREKEREGDAARGDVMAASASDRSEIG